MDHVPAKYIVIDFNLVTMDWLKKAYSSVEEEMAHYVSPKRSTANEGETAREELERGKDVAVCDTFFYTT